MRTTIPLFVVCCMLAGTAWSADDMKAADGKMKKDAMTLQECKDYMAMAKKDAMTKRDDAMAKKDAMCSDMVKKDEMMKKDAMSKKEEPMKK